MVGEYQETILVRNSKGMNAGSTLFGLMSRLKAEPAENTSFNWFERDPVKRSFDVQTTNATPPASQGVAGTLVIEATPGLGDAAWQWLASGMVLYNHNTGEYIQVSADPTTNTISVLRAINGGTLSGYTLTALDPLSIITLGKDEGGLPTRASYEEPQILTNYVQTFNSSVLLTNAFKANKLRSDAAGPLKARRIQAMEKIAKDIEMAFLVGTKQRVTGTNGYQYFTGGIKNAVDSFVPANAAWNAASAAPGSSLATTVMPWLQNFMTVGSDAKLALCGPQAYLCVQHLRQQCDQRVSYYEPRDGVRHEHHRG